MILSHAALGQEELLNGTADIQPSYNPTFITLDGISAQYSDKFAIVIVRHMNFKA